VGRRVEQDEGGAHGLPERRRWRGRETEERGREVDERGPGCKKQKVQGPYCKAWVTFKPELK
jgi:hypothetical protein